MRGSRPLIFNRVIPFLCRYSSFSSKNNPTIKVVSDESNISLSFQYFNYVLKLGRPKDEKLEVILSTIKKKAELQHKKEIIKQYYTTGGKSIEKSPVKDIDVCLMQNDCVLDSNISNCEAWPQASALSIGDVIYEVSFNIPSVKNLNLPDFLISCCALRPHFELESASQNDSIFTWYRSISEDYGKSLLQNKNNEILVGNGKYWKKIHEGYVYFISTDDIGCFLKVVCTPKLNDRTGPECSVESKAVVEAAPEFPFEERQEHTRTFCNDESTRCLTYNVLAKMYVEEQRFPYASTKARDTCYRKQILLKELVGYNSDIICLQEVEKSVFEKDLEPILNLKGYSGFYTRKGGNRCEGVATFIRSSKFKVKKSYDVLLNRIIRNSKHIYDDLLNKVSSNFKDMNKLLVQNTVLQLLAVEHSHLPGTELLIANTHLYSNKHNPEVRLLQAAICAYFIEHYIKIEGYQNPGVIFCGDFNSLPDSPTYNFLMSGKYECCVTWNIDPNSNDTMLEHNLNLDSACGTPEYTNYTESFTGCLDYIFYNKDILKVTDVVPMPRHEHVIAQVGLPSESFPSDHIPLICTFQWKNS
ncbi:CCR4-Not complex 3'-5'-exoribonuclease subunit Ccr4 [Caerostris darwini]|uniref:CCR4-Not complex 3'-5'-exoribonuclease subunit Ccr4 n=1 Tax=Caerostris darwini TaxID=1538125 RepID=A0AAV4S2D7_9ARAC|nr:CCR4-Not complex 3'-5'-exoribonuclease subunit Ccr4 [Caerostris darwini]